MLPIPGYSYFYGELVTGNINLVPVQSDDFATMFPVGYETSTVSSYRYAGMSMEIIPTVNAMTWTGSVQVTRGVVTVSVEATSSSAMRYTVGGLGPLLFTSKPDVVHPFNMGCYCTSRPTNHDFKFLPILTNTAYSEVAITPYGASKTAGFTTTQGFIGLGDMECIIYKIPAYSTTGNVGTIRTWANVEFTIPSTSPFYEYARLSPPEDKLALALAKRAYQEMSLCVPYYDNDNLWARVWEWAKKAAQALSYVPGPVGGVASGFSMMATGLDALTL